MKLSEPMTLIQKFFQLFVFMILSSSLAQASLYSEWRSRSKKADEQKKVDAFNQLQSDNFKVGIKSAPLDPNNVPDGKCVYKSQSLEIPGSALRVSQFEIWTHRKGTQDKEPVVTGYLKLRDGKTYKNDGGMTLPMTNLQLGWMTDRLGKPKGISEFTYRKDVDFEGVVYNVILKRSISDLTVSKMTSELILYTVSENPVPVLHARCTQDITTTQK